MDTPLNEIAIVFGWMATQEFIKAFVKDLSYNGLDATYREYYTDDKGALQI